MSECAPGCDYPITGYHARRGGKTLCPVEPAATKQTDFTPEEFRIAVRVQGEILDQVATISRKAKLSRNPGVSALGSEILTVVEAVL